MSAAKRRRRRRPRGAWVSCYCHGGIIEGCDGGPEEHRDCGGNGQIWRYPSGALALYPGGPFCGQA